MSEEQSEELIALDKALKHWQLRMSVKARLSSYITCVFSMEEIARLLNISEETAARYWRLARAWLLREMSAS